VTQGKRKNRSRPPLDPRAGRGKRHLLVPRGKVKKEKKGRGEPHLRLAPRYPFRELEAERIASLSEGGRKKKRFRDGLSVTSSGNEKKGKRRTSPN